MKNLFLYCFYSILFVLVFGSCSKLGKVDDISPSNIDAEYAIPLLTTNVNMNQLINEFDELALVEIEEDGGITLRYRGDFASTGGQDIFEELSILNGIPFQVVDTFAALPLTSLEATQVNYAIFKTGTIQYGFYSHHEEPITVTFRIPSLTKDGEPFEHTLNTLENDPSGTTVGGSDPLDITGYRLDRTSDSIYVEYWAYKEDSGVKDTLTEFGVIFNSLVASYVEGALSSQTTEFPRDTILIDFFENWTNGSLKFEEPVINIDISNSFGFPAKVYFDDIDIISVNDEVVSLESDYSTNGVDMDYPSLEEVGQRKFTSFSFNNQNSNVVDMFSIVPKAMQYEGRAVINEAGGTVIGFMTDTSEFIAQIEAILPVYGGVSNYNVFDSIDIQSFDFDANIDNYDDVEYGEFKFYTKNDIPLGIDMQLYFMGADQQIIDSLFSDGITAVAQPAVIDDQGNVTGSTATETLSRFTEDRIKRLEDADYMILKASLSTPNEGQQSVKIKADQDVSVSLGIKLGIKK